MAVSTGLFWAKDVPTPITITKAITTKIILYRIQSSLLMF
jgi:hypothetical protein